jgi:hypothetical protein
MTHDKDKPTEPQPTSQEGDPPDMMPPVDTVATTSEALGASLILPAGHGVGMARMVKTTMRLKAKKPNPRRFLRVHPDMSAAVAIFLDPNDEDEFEKAPYVVLGHVAEELSVEAVPNMVYLYTYRTGSLGLWPCPLAGPGGRASTAWGSTRLEIAEKAKTSWLRCHASVDGEGYAYTEPVDRFPEPDWDRLLRGRSMLQLLGIAFRDRVIDSVDHPVLREFEGRFG